jgi:signal peptidase I
MEQQSMEPTVEPGDLLLVSAQPKYERGDIVAFRTPPDWVADDSVFVKRIIAVAGDTVSIDSDHGSVSQWNHPQRAVRVSR